MVQQDSFSGPDHRPQRCRLPGPQGGTLPPTILNLPAGQAYKRPIGKGHSKPEWAGRAKGAKAGGRISSGWPWGWGGCCGGPGSRHQPLPSLSLRSLPQRSFTNQAVCPYLGLPLTRPCDSSLLSSLLRCSVAQVTAPSVAALCVQGPAADRQPPVSSARGPRTLLLTLHKHYFISCRYFPPSSRPRSHPLRPADTV